MDAQNTEWTMNMYLTQLENKYVASQVQHSLEKAKIQKLKGTKKRLSNIKKKL